MPNPGGYLWLPQGACFSQSACLSNACLVTQPYPPWLSYLQEFPGRALTGSEEKAAYLQLIPGMPGQLFDQ